jgi:pyruvate dehydrogenase (quinone)
MEGNPRFPTTQDIPDIPYARFAELIGLNGIFVDDPGYLAPAWEKALAADRPTVIEVKTDPEVAPFPPHLTFEQAKNFMKSIVKGDEGAGTVIADTARQLFKGLKS